MLTVTERENPVPLGRPASATPTRTPTRPDQEAAAAQLWAAVALDPAQEEAYLCGLAGVTQLADAYSLRAVVDASSATLSHWGPKLPSLQELNLSHSVLGSLRDLGTGFRVLSVLWVPRCGLRDLDGLSLLPALRELYAAFNDVADLQPLTACAGLEVADLEGNAVAGLPDMECLAGCPSLHSLTLAGNPVAATPGYAVAVASLLPGLQCLDDLPFDALGAAAGAGGSPYRVPTGNGNGDASLNDVAGATWGLRDGRPGADFSRELMALVMAGIKHARVGVDSHEYLEIQGGQVGALSPTAAGLPSAFSGGQASVASPGTPPRPGSGAPGCATGVLPQGATGWLRMLRASTEALPAPDGQRQAPGSSGSTLGSAGAPGEGGGSAGSSGSAWREGGPSPDPGSRPTTSSSTARDSRQSGRPGSSAAGRPASGSELPPRPFSARGGSGGAGAGRPATAAGAGASASPLSATVGLFWTKHRITAATLTSSDSAACVAGPGGTADCDGGADGDAAAASSALTFGGDAIGGSLARDLRRRKKGVVGHSSAVPVRASAPALLSARPAEPYDAARLLDELCAWKLDAADRSLAPEDGGAADEATDVWAGSGQGLTQAASEGSGMSPRPAPSDILDLTAERQEPGGSGGGEGDPGACPERALSAHKHTTPNQQAPETEDAMLRHVPKRNSHAAQTISAIRQQPGGGEGLALGMDAQPPAVPTPVPHARRHRSGKMVLAKVVQDVWGARQPCLGARSASAAQLSGTLQDALCGLPQPVARPVGPPTDSCSTGMRSKRRTIGPAAQAQAVAGRGAGDCLPMIPMPSLCSVPGEVDLQQLNPKPQVHANPQGSDSDDGWPENDRVAGGWAGGVRRPGS